MVDLRFTALADGDLEEIWFYTAQRWGIEQADSYLDSPAACCDAISAGRVSSKPVAGLADVLTCRCHHHYIISIEIADRIIVIAVLHERMDLLARIAERL